MKRFIITAVAASAIALTATTASAGTGPDPEYGGKVENKKSQYFGFDTQGKEVGDFVSVNLPVKCKNPKEKIFGSGPLPGGPYKIKKNGKFEGKANIDSTPRSFRGAEITGIKVAYEGKIEGKFATGTVQIETKGRKCDSGVLSWVARKPAPNPPDPKPNPARR